MILMLIRSWTNLHECTITVSLLLSCGRGGGGVFVWISNIEIVWPKTDTLGNAAVNLT